MKVTLGVLGIQGDVEENRRALEGALGELGLEGRVIWLKRLEQLKELDGLVIPGGESTVIGGLARYSGLLSGLREAIGNGLPVLGSCAGLITLAKRAFDRVVGTTNQPLLGLLDVTVERNAFGRQRESFEVDLRIPVLGEEPFRAIFIRAPAIREVGKEVEVLATLGESVVAVRQGNILGTCFHPELSNDPRLHIYFLEMVRRRA